jgi:hypothetical protein
VVSVDLLPTRFFSWPSGWLPADLGVEIGPNSLQWITLARALHFRLGCERIVHESSMFLDVFNVTLQRLPHECVIRYAGTASQCVYPFLKRRGKL